MTREDAYNELIQRLERDLKNHVDYCIGEKPLRALLRNFLLQTPIPSYLCSNCFADMADESECSSCEPR